MLVDTVSPAGIRTDIDLDRRAELYARTIDTHASHSGA